jgi:SAM-dependent methyltransferase
MVKNIYEKIKNFLEKRSEVKRKIKKFGSIKKFFDNKIGLEIGGPSSAFMDNGYMPIYKIMKSLDGANFSSSTVWTGKIKNDKGFIVNGKNTGRMYIADATDLNQIENGIYDFILSCNNIEHIANPMKAINQWISKLKQNGVLVIIAPRKETNFDHKRETVEFSHLLEDYNNNVDEHDLTHLDEILKLHDLTMDPPAGTLKQFKERSMKNYENRCLHHHVFDLNVLEQMCNHFKLIPILTSTQERDYIIVAKNPLSHFISSS